MGFFDTFGETVAAAGKTVGGKTKEMAGAARLSLQITQEESRLSRAFAALGEAYYRDHKDDMPEGYGALAADIEASAARLESLKQEKQILKNQKRCERCGAWMLADDRFCGKCGADNERNAGEDENKTTEEAL